MCKKAVDICNRSKLYVKWAYFCSKYIDNVENQEKEEFLANNKRYETYLSASEKVSLAVEEYIKANKDECKDLLLDSSEIFEKLFDGKYNPALVNICFMARRGEIQDVKISVLDELNKVTWMDNDAFLNINKALYFVMEAKWEEARREIREISSSLSEALEWWSQENVVGKFEKNMVLLLLILENKINQGIEEITMPEFWIDCKESISMPEEVEKEFTDVQNKYILNFSE